MFTFKHLSVLAAVAGLALALPTPAEDSAIAARQWRGPHGYWQHPGEDVVWVTVTATAEGTSLPTSTPAATPVSSSASVSTPAFTPASTPASTAAAATATPSTDTSGAVDWLSVANKWRTAGGLPEFSEDSTLVANALKTSTDSVGGLKHELNPGTFAQVLAPGSDTLASFTSVYVGGWLCEIPSLPGLDGICATAAQGWDHSDGETGHADILTSTSYTKIGCAISSSTNVWACDAA